MRHKGRWIAVVIAVICYSCSVFYSYIRTNQFDYFRLIGYPIFLGLAYWCGQLYDKAVFFSIRDPLTELFNRRYVIEAFKKLIASHKWNKKTPYVVVMDCDNFKCVNDELGHETGDVLLKTVAAIILRNIGKRDLGARWGGDEFLILGLTSGSQELELLVKRIEDDIQITFQAHNWSNASLSIGTAMYSTDKPSFEKLVHIADQNMYFDKMSKKQLDL